MPRADRVLLDTHALLWWQGGGDRLSTGARVVIENATVRLVSPLSCWEVAMLVDKRRIALDRPVSQWVGDLFDDRGVDIAELTAAAAVEAGMYEGMHGDPVDRMLYATARALDVPLVTKDRSLHDFAADHGGVSVLW